MPQIAVTVVVPTYRDQSWETLVRAIASARSQTHRPAEVVVVVDHDHAHYLRVRRDLAGVTVLENEYAPGSDGCRDTGAFWATTALIAFLADDAVADPAWLARLVPSFDDPAVVGASGGPGELMVVRRGGFRSIGGFRAGTDLRLRLTALPGARWAEVPGAVIRQDRGSRRDKPARRLFAPLARLVAGR